jgi:hypothetical protein
MMIKRFAIKQADPRRRMYCPGGQRIANMVGDALAQGGSTSYKPMMIKTGN